MTILCRWCGVNPAHWKNKGRDEVVKYCTSCREPNMTRRSYICKTEGCAKQASYGFVKGTPEHCGEHKSDDMENLTSNSCEYKDCLVRPSFNYDGKTEKVRCSKHALPGMINVSHKTCHYEGCNTRASFSFIGNKDTAMCAKHKKKGMVDVNRKGLCLFSGCKTRASHGSVEENIPKYCAKHASEDMTNLVSKRCLFKGCNTMPTFGKKGSLKAEFCFSHKKDDMVDVKHPTCSFGNCKTRPSRGTSGEIRNTRCVKHAEPGMIDLKKVTCLAENCRIAPMFNFEGEKKGIYCKAHKTKDMINVEERRSCVIKDCNKRPGFNYLGNQKGLFCSFHKRDEMVDVNANFCEVEGCKTRAWMGYLHSKKIRCSSHSVAGMYSGRKISPKCDKEDCGQKAYYCPPEILYPERCETHKKEDDIKLEEKECEICLKNIPLLETETKCQECTEYQKNPLQFQRSKERRIKDVLEANNFEIISYDKIFEGGCSKRRPDFVLDYKSFFIIIEVDENAHRDRPCDCEISRMVEIHQDFGGACVLFIRYNPDDYTTSCGDRTKGFTKNKKREARLLTLLERLKQKIPVGIPAPLAAYYLFYDNDDGVDRFLKLDYERNIVREDDSMNISIKVNFSKAKEIVNSVLGR